MRFEGLKKLRWFFFVLAAIGIAYTPSEILRAVSEAKSDHRLIFGYAIGLVIRLLFIFYSFKIWWETRPKNNPTPNPNSPLK